MAKEPAGRDLSLHAEDAGTSLSIFSREGVVPASHPSVSHLVSQGIYGCCVLGTAWQAEARRVGVGD